MEFRGPGKETQRYEKFPFVHALTQYGNIDNATATLRPLRMQDLTPILLTYPGNSITKNKHFTKSPVTI